MYYISKNNLTTIPIKIDSNIVNDLKYTYIQSEIQINRKSRVVNFLSELKRNEFWIICDCHFSEQDNSNIINLRQKNTIMTIKHRESTNLYYFSKTPKSIEHESCCPFNRENDEHDGGYNRNDIREEKEVEYFAYAKKVDGLKTFDTKKDDNHRKQGSTGPSIGRLGKYLLKFIHNSNLNVCYANKINNYEDRLSNYLSKNKMTRNISLNSCVLFSKDMDFNKFKAFKDRVSILDWEETYIKQGFVLFYSNGFALKDKIMTTNNGGMLKYTKNLKFINGVVSRSVKLNKNSTYLVLSSFVFLGKNFAQIESSFVIPVYSKEFPIPYESMNEKYVLEKIFDIVEALNEKNIRDIKISKPVLDIKINDSFCRPDFILSINGKKIIVEVKGYNDEEYNIRKERTHKVMNKIGDFIEIDATEFSDKNERYRRLNEFENNILNRFIESKDKTIQRLKEFVIM